MCCYVKYDVMISRCPFYYISFSFFWKCPTRKACPPCRVSNSSQNWKIPFFKFITPHDNLWCCCFFYLLDRLWCGVKRINIIRGYRLRRWCDKISAASGLKWPTDLLILLKRVFFPVWTHTYFCARLVPGNIWFVYLFTWYLLFLL